MRIARALIVLLTAALLGSGLHLALQSGGNVPATVGGVLLIAVGLVGVRIAFLLRGSLEETITHLQSRRVELGETVGRPPSATTEDVTAPVDTTLNNDDSGADEAAAPFMNREARRRAVRNPSGAGK